MARVLGLVDLNPSVVEALRESFAGFPEVTVELGDLLQVASGVIVSPANSQGFMDGGIDRAYAGFFGSDFARLVRDSVLRQPEGHLPVGAAIALPTGHARIHHVVVAPTMFSPEHVPRQNAYRALRAALRVMSSQPELGDVLFSPGLCTLVGQVPPDEAAEEMAAAYADWRAG